MITNDLNLKIKLISSMGLSLHRYGTNAYKLEEVLKQITTALDMKGQFFSTPTYLAISLKPNEDLSENEITKHLRVIPGEANLYKLQLLYELANNICYDNISVKEALIEVSNIENEKPLYGQPLMIFSFGLTSLAISLLLNGGFYDNIISFVLGLFVGVLNYFKSKNENLTNIFEFLSAIGVTSLSYIIFNYITVFNFHIVMISSLIVIIPGLSFTIAMIELATQNLASGTARLMGSLVDLLKLAFGIYIGLEISHHFFYKIDNLAALNNTSWAAPASVFLAAIGFTMIFNAKKSDFIWILYSGVIAVSSIKIFHYLYTSVVATFLAAFTVAIISNIFSRLKNEPSIKILLPAIIFMVPGSLGLKGLNFLLNNDIMNGFTSGVQMFSVAISIVAGLFFASTVLPPKKGL